MKKIIYMIVMGGVCASCVDDYTDANPPRLLDAPAVSKVEVTEDEVTVDESTTISIEVVDAPAGLDSVAVNDFDQSGDPVEGTINLDPAFQGLKKGTVNVTYRPPMMFPGNQIDLVAQVFDGQVDNLGMPIRKSSGSFTNTIRVYCGDLRGTYEVEGEILQDDFGTGTLSGTGRLGLASCETEGAYQIPDITGGLYTTTYAENYGTEAAEAVIEIDFATGDVTWQEVGDQFGGSIVEDPDAPESSNYDAATNTITLYWTATAFGEFGVTRLVLQ